MIKGVPLSRLPALFHAVNQKTPDTAAHRNENDLARDLNQSWFSGRLLFCFPGALSLLLIIICCASVVFAVPKIIVVRHRFCTVRGWTGAEKQGKAPSDYIDRAEKKCPAGGNLPGTTLLTMAHARGCACTRHSGQR